MKKYLSCALLLSCVYAPTQSFHGTYNEPMLLMEAIEAEILYQYYRMCEPKKFHNVSIEEKESSYIMEIEVPGYEKDELEVLITHRGRGVTIKGARKALVEELNEQNESIKK